MKLYVFRKYRPYGFRPENSRTTYFWAYPVNNYDTGWTWSYDRRLNGTLHGSGHGMFHWFGKRAGFNQHLLADWIYFYYHVEDLDKVAKFVAENTTFLVKHPEKSELGHMFGFAGTPNYIHRPKP